MKNNYLHYFSLLCFLVSIYLLMEHGDSNRMSLIAGGLTFVAFATNSAAYSAKNNRKE